MSYRIAERQRAFQRNWVARRRASWLAENGPCVGCGATDHLEVDHVYPEQKVDHRVWSWSDERRQEELAKCRVLCRDCHKARHAARHGTAYRFQVHGCRCEPCRAARAIKSKLDKLKRRMRLQAFIARVREAA